MRPCRSPRRLAAHPLLVTAVLALSVACRAASQSPEPPRVDAADRGAIIDGISEALARKYVFPDVAVEMDARLRGQLASGAYEALDTLPEFTARLTEDLQAVSSDLHLRVFWDPEPPPAEPDPEDAAQRRAAFEARLRADNFCFRKVERLTGNVGYLKLDCFAPAELGGETAIAAMGFLANAEALIIDLRDNGGGQPSMIQLLTSYLVEERTHLNSFYVRETDETRQFWSQAHVPGRRMAGVPVWVLTSARTFSAAEEFSYNLRNLERATLVGETTGGGAHPVETEHLEGYPVAINLPFGRAVNPISGTNWEGTGVEPHVETPAAEALDAAYGLALQTVVERVEDPERKARLAFTVETLKLRRAPVALPAAALAEYAGSYGPRRVRLEGDTLFYSREGGPEYALLPVGGDRFLVGEIDIFRLRFERDRGGAVVRVVGLYEDGREEPSERDGG